MYIFNLIHIIPQVRTLSCSPPSFHPRIQDSTWSIVEGDRSSHFPGIKQIRPSLIRDYRWPKGVLAAGLDRQSVAPDGSMRHDLSSAPKSTGKSSNSYTFFFLWTRICVDLCSFESCSNCSHCFYAKRKSIFFSSQTEQLSEVEHAWHILLFEVQTECAHDSTQA